MKIRPVSSHALEFVAIHIYILKSDIFGTPLHLQSRQMIVLTVTAKKIQHILSFVFQENHH